jgi:beta-glucanase (GH16 family)
MKKLLMIFVGIVGVISLQAQNAAPLPLKLRVGTYNVGHFNQGSPGGYPNAYAGQVDKQLQKWKNWVGQQSLDILFLNEWNAYFNAGADTINAADVILKPYYNHIAFGRRSEWIYNGIATNFALSNIRQLQFTHPDYYALLADADIAGHRVVLVSAHLPWQEEHFSKSLDILIREIERYDYVICGGDMNAVDADQCRFTAAGFNMANGGNGEWFNTTSNVAIYGRPVPGRPDGGHIDNIVTTKNIKLMRVSAPATGLNDTDHFPVMCDAIITNDPPLADSPWTLVWEENFDGNSLDTGRWNRIWRGRADWNRYMSQRDDLVQVKNGELILRGIRNDVEPSDTARYLTGGVDTQRKVAFGRGRLEIKAKLQGARGAWPAIWMMPFDGGDKWPKGGEIDIMERLNHDDFAHQTLHSYNTQSRKITTPQRSGKGKINPKGYNIYAVEVYADSISFYINQNHTYTCPHVATEYPNFWQFPFDRLNFLMIDMQLGGSWVGKVEDSELPVEMRIDWVRYYQKK